MDAKWFKGGDITYDPSSIYPEPDPSMRKPVKEVKPIDKSVDLEPRRSESHPRSRMWIIYLILFITIIIVYWLVIR